MTINKGDKLVVTKNVMELLNKGDIVKVVDINNNGMISFAFGEDFVHMGLMNAKECEEHFTKYVEQKAPTITTKMIEKIINDSEIEIQTIHDKCTVVSCKLPNGFVIVESSACVSPENYDEDMGVEICMDRIISKVWELEGYKLQSKLYEEKTGCSYSCNCEDCLCDCETEEDDEEDECLDTDLDCDNCEHYNECWK